MKNRLFATLLLFALVFTAFAGCREGAADNPVRSGDTSQLPSAAGDSTDETSAPTGAAQESTPTESSAQSAAELTAEEAEAIALADAGFTKEQVTRLHTEYDIDRGVGEYEVEFHCDGWEYDYEIHAETGEILRSEKETDR